MLRVLQYLLKFTLIFCAKTYFLDYCRRRRVDVGGRGPLGGFAFKDMIINAFKD